MRRPLPLVVFLIFAAVLAGCSSPAPAGVSSHTDETAAQAGAIEKSGPAPVPPGRWDTQEFSGEFTTTAFVDPMSSVLGSDTVSVPQDARHVWFNGTLTLVAPDAVKVRLIPPGCTAGSCFVEGSVEGSAFALDGGDDPFAGDWSIVFFAQTAAQRGSYTVEVNSLLPA